MQQQIKPNKYSGGRVQVLIYFTHSRDQINYMLAKAKYHLILQKHATPSGVSVEEVLYYGRAVTLVNRENYLLQMKCLS